MWSNDDFIIYVTSLLLIFISINKGGHVTSPPGATSLVLRYFFNISSNWNKPIFFARGGLSDFAQNHILTKKSAKM